MPKRANRRVRGLASLATAFLLAAAILSLVFYLPSATAVTVEPGDIGAMAAPTTTPITSPLSSTSSTSSTTTTASTTTTTATTTTTTQPGSAPPDTFTTMQLTTNTATDRDPQISGDRVVWEGSGGTDGGTDEEIFTWTLAGGTVQLTTNSTRDFYPRVSGDRVVWRGRGGTDGGTDFEIFTWTPAGGTVQLTTNSTPDNSPQVSGNRVVWRGSGGTDGGSDSEIFTAVLTPVMTFSDVETSHPYYLAIEDLADRGIINGYPDGTFRPNDPVTRQQFAKMIVRTLAYAATESNVCPFGDVMKSLPGSYVDLTDPLYPDHYVAVCAAYGITQGKTPTTFAPYDNITRQQLITMVARAANLPEPPAGYTPPFSPGQFYPAEHYQNARKAAYAGLLDGLQGMGASYNFMSPATRGEVCVLLYNLLNR